LHSLSYFARSLGAEDLGKFTAVASLTTIAFPFSTLGSDFLLSREVSRDKSKANESWGNSLLITVISSGILILLLFFIARIILPKSISPLTLFLIFLTETLCLAIWGCNGSILIALDRHKKVAQLGATYNFIKLLAVIVLAVIYRNHGVQTWACLYFTSTVIMIFISCSTVISIVGLPSWPKLHYLKEYVREGIYFSIGGSTAFFSQNIDKTLLASLSTLEATGLYSAAFRFIDMACLPMGVLSGSLHAKFFSEGAFGIRKVFQFAQRLFLPVFIYGSIVFIGCLSLGFLIPILLGNEYRDSIPALYWLAPLPLIRGFQWILNDILDGSDNHRGRSAINILSVFYTLPLLYFLIPKYSWKGAAWGAVASMGIGTIFYWGLVKFLCHRQFKLGHSKS
jgi:O-antigen/teichoic acid export membrane protein